MFDYHVHTTRSVDCHTPIEASCEAAIDRGVTEIAFTDHVDFEPADEGYGFYDYAGFMDDIARVRERFGDRLAILAGAEIDFNTGTASQVAAFRGSHDFDFVIGSVHFGENGEIIFPRYFAGRTLDDVFLPYYENIQAAAESGLFDTIGHLDLPQRYAPPEVGSYEPLRYEAQVRPIFQAIIDRGISFEINTSGLRQAPKSTMPGIDLVRVFAAMGGQTVTIGSDSHVASTIGAGFDTAIAMLREAGVPTVSSFREGVRSLVPLETFMSVGVATGGA
ncbi:MAG TPA: histidinol-phosphatase [Thermomicrobiales bacterium]|nr:histidinol-phosphatase [Thermomicrobiales bacterium]